MKRTDIDFGTGLKFGGIGERVFWDVMNSRSDVRQVIDVRKDKNFQKDDVDFLVEFNSRQFSKFEVKTDRKAHETGNFPYETESFGKEGCASRTQADLFFLYLYETSEYCFINVEKAREYIEHCKPKLYDMGEGGGKGYLLPIKELQENKTASKLVRICR